MSVVDFKALFEKHLALPESSTPPSSGGSNNGGTTTDEPAPIGRIVYWTPGGTSYHYNKSCSTLARSKTIIEGKSEDCPKTDPCNKCVH